MIDFTAIGDVGALASIIALVISIIGFGVIIYNVIKTRGISLQVRNDLLRADTVLQFSSAISAMEEIKTLHREGAWRILPDRYSSLRKTLISIKQSNIDLSVEQSRNVQITISSLSNIEHEIEKCSFHKTSPTDVPRLNKTISTQIDRLQPILVEISNKIGR